VKNLIVLTSFLFTFVSHGQDLHLEENKFLGYIYQQDGYLLMDPKGDVLLLWTAHQIPQFILANLKGKQSEILAKRSKRIEELLIKYPEYRPVEESKNTIANDYITFNPEHEAIELEGHEAPFKARNIALMMKQVIIEEYQLNGIVPKRGDTHKWSPEIKKELHKNFTIFSRMSKLLVALSRGGTSHYMVTGTEENLKDYIISRPENSINLEEMFRASYRINQGDAYLTLLTIENVLSRFWLTPQRSKRLILTKLKDITNFNYKTDKFGSWYHLFGIMLFGYAEGGLKAKLVGNIETMGSQLMGRFQDEKQETYINNRGGSIGSKIRRFIKRNEFEDFKQNKRYTEEEFYMDLEEDFSKRIEKNKNKASQIFLPQINASNI